MLTALVLAAALTPGVTQSFESGTKLPSDYGVVEYSQGVSQVGITRGSAADGESFLRIRSQTPNHTRVTIPADVEPNSTYRFSASIRSPAREEVTAALGMADSNGYISPKIPGDGQWHRESLYLRTGSASEVTLLLTFGWYGDVVAGRADFDDVSLTKVDAAPDGALVAEFESAADAGPAEAPSIDQGPNGIVYPLVGVLVLLAAGAGVVLLRSRSDES